jgi:hypothetical protein
MFTYVLGFCMLGIGVANIMFFIGESFHSEVVIEQVIYYQPNDQFNLIANMLFNISSLESWIYACNVLRSAILSSTNKSCLSADKVT